MACEVGWLDAGDTDLGCLYFEKTKMNHASATTFCQDRSAHLIEIFTLDQLEFIRMQLRVIEEQEGLNCHCTYGYNAECECNWLGGATDEGREGNFIWEHSKRPVGDFVWGGNDPDGGSWQNIFVFYRHFDYMGIDESASNTFRLICQKPYSEVESDTKVVFVADEGAISG